MPEEEAIESHQSHGSATANDPADLVLTFVNTQASGGGRTEWFTDRDALFRWFEEHHLLDDPAEVSDSDSVAARELRDALSVLLEAHVGAADPGDAITATSQLRRTAERFPLLVHIDADGSRLVSAQHGVPGAFAAILAAVATTTASGQWSRVKMCKNPPCHTAFVDKTKNSAGLFCSAKCGSQLAMRAYRSRLRSE